jgi:hypothetical protein
MMICCDGSTTQLLPSLVEGLGLAGIDLLSKRHASKFRPRFSTVRLERNSGSRLLKRELPLWPIM